jgi:hypothetical protein
MGMRVVQGGEFFVPALTVKGIPACAGTRAWILFGALTAELESLVHPEALNQPRGVYYLVSGIYQKIAFSC